MHHGRRDHRKRREVSWYRAVQDMWHWTHVIWFDASPDALNNRHDVICAIVMISEWKSDSHNRKETINMLPISSVQGGQLLRANGVCQIIEQASMSANSNRTNLHVTITSHLIGYRDLKTWVPQTQITDERHAEDSSSPQWRWFKAVCLLERDSGYQTPYLNWKWKHWTWAFSWIWPHFICALFFPPIKLC